MRKPAQGSPPQYRLQITRPGARTFWYQAFFDRQADALIKAQTLAAQHPDDTIQLRRMKQFKHREALRWSFEGDRWKIIGRYDQLAIGKTVPKED